MKIVIDARMLPFTGIGRYISNTIKNFPNNNELNKIIIVPENILDYSFLSNPNRKLIGSDLQRYTISEHTMILSTLLRERASLFHSMNYIMPTITPCPSIVTIYDLIRLKIPYTFYTNKEFISIFGLSRFLQMASIALSLGTMPALRNHKHFKSASYNSWISNIQIDRYQEFKFHHLYQMALINRVVKNCKRIITVSEHSKNDIVKFFNTPNTKIDVVYPGVSTEFKQEKNINNKLKITEKYSLPNKFVLYVGLWRPHKNVHGLIEAFHELLQQPSCPHDLGLVLVGPNDNFETHVQKRIDQLGLNNNVMSVGFVPDDDLRIIYSLAMFLVMPSFYEGFGLPVLEAMACGTPVIASSTTSLPEVVGTAGLLVNPSKSDTITEAMLLLLSNEELRHKLSIEGINRAHHFTWKKTADKTTKIYEDALT